MAGELVVVVNSEPGASRCEWDTEGMASCLYLAIVEITDADGSWRRQFLKAMFIH
jgi:hypothetical protein